MSCFIFRVLLEGCLKPLCFHPVCSINITVDFTQYNWMEKDHTTVPTCTVRKFSQCCSLCISQSTSVKLRKIQTTCSSWLSHLKKRDWRASQFKCGVQRMMALAFLHTMDILGNSSLPETQAKFIRLEKFHLDRWYTLPSSREDIVDPNSKIQ